MSSMMAYKGYHANVEYDSDDNILVGTVFGISDSLSFHGSSTDGLYSMFKQCIDNYLVYCAEVGKKPEKEYKGSFNVRMTPEKHRAASMEAERENISLNQLMCNAVDMYLTARA